MWKYCIALGILVFGMIGGYNLVFSGNINYTPDIRFATSLGSFVVPDTEENLSKNYIIYSSNIDISHARVESLCDISSRYLGKQQKYFLFEIDYSQDQDCSSGDTLLVIGEDKYPNTHHSLPVLQSDTYFDFLLDHDSSSLNSLLVRPKKDMTKYSLYRNFQGNISIEHLKYIFGQRKFLEAEYSSKIVTDILTARDKKYILPIDNSVLSEAFTKVPNSPRPYRAAYTDGIHHGWDIDGELREEVIAVDDGVIVRVVDEFSDADYERIEYSENDDIHRGLKNLDILRGKQIWLKTMKGDVVFYSHLDEIYDEVKEGVKVERGERLGRTGVTGVPEEGYDDYHLHFAVMKNPYNLEIAGKYDFGDYMAWDWYTKGMSHSEVLVEQKKIFEY